jgi:hypothetical protein
MVLLAAAFYLASRLLGGKAASMMKMRG